MSTTVAHRLTDLPPFITNLVDTIDIALDALHDIGPDQPTPEARRALNRAVALLMVGREAAALMVEAVERGPDFELGGRA